MTLDEELKAIEERDAKRAAIVITEPKHDKKIVLKTVSKEELERMVSADLWREKYRIKEAANDMDIGSIRSLNMSLNKKQRAERTVFLMSCSREEVLEIHGYEQSHFSWRFMTFSEMKRLTAKTMKDIR